MKTLVVLGMHRSGTSMVGGVLARLGVNMGENYYEGKISANPLGFYEDLDFLELNKEIIKKAGGSWHNPPAESSILSQEESFLLRITDLLAQKKGIWGWKDPRTCLTIKLYEKYLKNVYYIVCHRDLKSIAESLYKRNKFSYAQSKELIEIYQERIATFFGENPGLKRLDLYYRDLLRKPDYWVGKIIKFAALNVNSSQFASAVDFIIPPNKLKNIKTRRLMYRLLNLSFKDPLKAIKLIKSKIKNRMK